MGKSEEINSLHNYENMALGETLKIKKLQNGLKCYIIPKKGFIEKMAVLCVNFGSNVDRFCNEFGETFLPQGVAHFLEHKVFEDEKTPVFEQFSALGASVNAYTDYNSTAYYFSTSDNFTKCLDALLNFVTKSYFTDENIEKEKAIIAAEIDMYVDNAFFEMHNNLLLAMYEKSAIRNPIAGTKESISTIDKNHLDRCYDAFYVPENMAVICVGDFCEEEIFEICAQVPSKPFSAKPMFSPEPKEILKPFITKKMSVSRPMFSLGLKEMDFKSPSCSRIVETKILLECLFGESSDFFSRLYNDGMVDGTFALEYVANKLYGLSVVSATCKDVGYVTDQISRHIDFARKNGIDSNRFERIRKKQMGQFIFNFDSIDTIAMSYVDFFAKNINAFDLYNHYEIVDEYAVNSRISAFFEKSTVSEILPGF